MNKARYLTFKLLDTKTILIIPLKLQNQARSEYSAQSAKTAFDRMVRTHKAQGNKMKFLLFKAFQFQFISLF